MGKGILFFFTFHRLAPHGPVHENDRVPGKDHEMPNAVGFFRQKIGGIVGPLNFFQI